MLPSDAGPKLRLLVYDASRELCRVAMPLAALDNLEHMFPDEDLRTLKARGIDFSAVAERARSSGYAAQTLIELETPSRGYRLWIE